MSARAVLLRDDQKTRLGVSFTRKRVPRSFVLRAKPRRDHLRHGVIRALPFRNVVENFQTPAPDRRGNGGVDGRGADMSVL